MSSLQPLYDVKERLEYAAIAGTGLLDEDFRLRRAAESLKPLAAASPVLRKISARLDELLAAPPDQRPGLLLDVLGLADAVAYTQGTSGLAGDMRDLPTGGGDYQQIPYSQIKPLLTALTTTGSGRIEVIRANWAAHPEYFTDFRVLSALVNDLGDTYVEITEFIVNILKTLGPIVLPVLKAGFDPKGKKDMVRRVHIIEDIAGSGASDFYFSQIPEAEKAVRAALVYALRHDEGNVEKLIGLSRTEKGNAKKMALWALARMDCPAAQDYWLQSKKTRKLALQYALHSTTPVSSALTAEALDRWLAPYEADINTPLDLKGKEAIEGLLNVLPGKSGPEICDIYRRMAAIDTALDSKRYPNANGKSTYMLLRSESIFGYGRAFNFSMAIPILLRWSILFHPTPDLMDLAVELWKKDPTYAPAGITAALLSKSAAEAFELFELLLHNMPKTVPLLSAFENLIWDKDYGRAAYHIDACHIILADPAGKSAEVVRPLAEPLDRRWYKAITALGGPDVAMDRQLTRLVPLDDQELCYQVGEYLYNRSLQGIGLDYNRMRALQMLGWKKYGGLAVNYCIRQKSESIWGVMQILGQLPGSKEDRQREGRAVLDLIADGKFHLRSGTREQLKEFIENMRDF